jgi:hypothetical protein
VVANARTDMSMNGLKCISFIYGSECTTFVYLVLITGCWRGCVWKFVLYVQENRDLCKAIRNDVTKYLPNQRWIYVATPNFAGRASRENIQSTSWWFYNASGEMSPKVFRSAALYALQTDGVYQETPLVYELLRSTT